MITYKRVCKFHKVVKKGNLVPCETKIRPLKLKDNLSSGFSGNVKGYISSSKNLTGLDEEYCPMCEKEGTNYGIKTAILQEE